jgi:omega-amidase
MDFTGQQPQNTLMRLYCVQLNIAWEDKPANFARVRQLLTAAHVEPGSLVLLPEMFATGFSLNTQKTGEPPGGPTHVFVAELAKEFRSTIVGAVAQNHPLRGVGTESVSVGAPTGMDSLSTNRSPVFSPTGQLIADYAKFHPFSFGKEPLHFTSGNTLQFFQWNDLTVCPTICYDLRFPEFYRQAVRKGAQLFTVIANWPSEREHHWTTLLQARAIENQSFVAGCNRCGDDPHLPYNGHSLIVDPTGKILADAGSDERVISAEINPETLTTWRKEFPALNDIRPDLLTP